MVINTNSVIGENGLPENPNSLAYVRNEDLFLKTRKSPADGNCHTSVKPKKSNQKSIKVVSTGAPTAEPKKIKLTTILAEVFGLIVVYKMLSFWVFTDDGLGSPLIFLLYAFNIK